MVTQFEKYTSEKSYSTDDDQQSKDTSGLDDDLKENVERGVFSPDFAKKQQSYREDDDDDDGSSSSRRSSSSGGSSSGGSSSSSRPKSSKPKTTKPKEPEQTSDLSNVFKDTSSRLKGIDDRQSVLGVGYTSGDDVIKTESEIKRDADRGIITTRSSGGSSSYKQQSTFDPKGWSPKSKKSSPQDDTRPTGLVGLGGADDTDDDSRLKVERKKVFVGPDDDFADLYSDKDFVPGDSLPEGVMGPVRPGRVKNGETAAFIGPGELEDERDVLEQRGETLRDTSEELETDYGDLGTRSSYTATKAQELITRLDSNEKKINNYDKEIDEAIKKGNYDKAQRLNDKRNKLVDDREGLIKEYEGRRKRLQELQKRGEGLEERRQDFEEDVSEYQEKAGIFSTRADKFNKIWGPDSKGPEVPVTESTDALDNFDKNIKKFQTQGFVGMEVSGQKGDFEPIDERRKKPQKKIGGVLGVGEGREYFGEELGRRKKQAWENIVTKNWEDKSWLKRGKDLGKGVLAYTFGAELKTTSDQYRATAEELAQGTAPLSKITGKSPILAGFAESGSRVASMGSPLTFGAFDDELTGRDISRLSGRGKRDFEKYSDIIDAVDILVGVGAASNALEASKIARKRNIKDVKDVNKVLDEVGVSRITDDEAKQILKIRRKAARKAGKRGIKSDIKEVEDIMGREARYQDLQSGWYDTIVKGDRLATSGPASTYSFADDVGDVIERLDFTQMQKSPFKDVDIVKKTDTVALTGKRGGRTSEILTDEGASINIPLSSGRKASISSKGGKAKTTIFSPDDTKIFEDVDDVIGKFDFGRTRTQTGSRKGPFISQDKKELTQTQWDLGLTEGAGFEPKGFRTADFRTQTKTTRRTRAFQEQGQFNKILDEFITEPKRKELKFVSGDSRVPKKQTDVVQKITDNIDEVTGTGIKESQTRQLSDVDFVVGKRTKPKSRAGQRVSDIAEQAQEGIVDAALSVDKRGNVLGVNRGFGQQSKMWQLPDNVFDFKQTDNFLSRFDDVISSRATGKISKSPTPSGLKRKASRFVSGVNVKPPKSSSFRPFGTAFAGRNIQTQTSGGRLQKKTRQTVSTDMDKVMKNFEEMKTLPKFDFESKSTRDFDSKMIQDIDTRPIEDFDDTIPRIDPVPPTGGVPGIKQFTGFGAIAGSFKPRGSSKGFKIPKRFKTKTTDRFLKDLWKGL